MTIRSRAVACVVGLLVAAALWLAVALASTDPSPVEVSDVARPTMIDTMLVPSRFVSMAELEGMPVWTVSPIPDLDSSWPGERVDEALLLADGTVIGVLEKRDPVTLELSYRLRTIDGTPGGRAVPMPVGPGGVVLASEINFAAMGDSVFVAGTWAGAGACMASDRAEADCAGNVMFSLPRLAGSVEPNGTQPRGWGATLGVLGDRSLVVSTSALGYSAGDEWMHFGVLRVPPAIWTRPGVIDQRVAVDTLFVRARQMNRQWAHSPSVAVAPDRVWVAPTDRPEVLAISPAGVPQLRIVWDAGDRVIPPSALDRWRERYAGVAGYGLDADPVTHHSAIAALAVARGGRLYVRTMAVLGYPQPSDTWLVFEPDGRAVARLEGPAAGDIMAIDIDHVVLRKADSNGILHIGRHTIVRPPE